MKTIYKEFVAGMENLQNSFIISFLPINFLQDKSLSTDIIITIPEFSIVYLKASQLYNLGQDIADEYVSSIRRHMLNDIVICYERYATRMYVSFKNNLTLTEPATGENRGINSSCFEGTPQLYTEEEIVFFKQLRHLRNSIVHYNGVYTKANPLDYTFGKDVYHSQGKEGQPITIRFDSIMYIHTQVQAIVNRINDRFFELYG